MKIWASKEEVFTYFFLIESAIQLKKKKGNIIRNFNFVQNLQAYTHTLSPSQGIFKIYSLRFGVNVALFRCHSM